MDNPDGHTERVMNSAMTPKPESLAQLVFLIRGEKVMLDSDLAELYGVPTKVLNQAVRRNPARFPEDFMFQLTLGEARDVRRVRPHVAASLPATLSNPSQNVMSSTLR